LLRRDITLTIRLENRKKKLNKTNLHKYV